MRRYRLLAAGAILTLMAITAIGVIAITNPGAFWTADGRAVAESLQRAGDGFAVLSPCDQHDGASRWRCDIEDDPGSGVSDAYLVVVVDDCWRAVRIGGVDFGKSPLAGCFLVLDFVWP